MLAQALPQALSWGDSCTRGWQEPGRATAVMVGPETPGEWVGGARGMWGLVGFLEEHGGLMTPAGERGVDLLLLDCDRQAGVTANTQGPGQNSWQAGP